MPRYLFHSSDATYDAASKTYTFTIEKRVPNAKSLTINRFGYTASTAASYPHAVYVRSDAITGLIKVKHAMEVTSAGHEDQSNVVAVLEEAHGIGRYQLDRGRHRYPLVRFHNQTTIDFQFTNGSTVLAGVYAPAVTPGITAADIEALYDAGSVVLWVDMAYPGAVRDANQDDADLGESVVDVKARKPDPFGAVTFLTSGLDKIQKVSFGANGAMAVTGQVASSWQYLLDSNNTDNPADLVVGSYIFMMRTPPTTALDQVWDSGHLRLYVGGGNLQVRAYSGQYHNLVPVDTGTDYLITIEYDLTNDPASNVMKGIAEKLSDSSVVENEITVLNQDFTASSPYTLRKYYSSAQTHLTAHMSDTIHCTTAVAPTVRTWLRQIYTGESSGIPGTPDPDAVDATFYADCSIDSH